MYAARRELAKQNISNAVKASTVGRGHMHLSIPTQGQSSESNPTGSGAKLVILRRHHRQR